MDVGEQAAFLSTILESFTEHAIIANDLEGRIVAWNEGARRVYGYDPDDVLGRSVFLLQGQDDRAGVRGGGFLTEARAQGRWEGRVGHMRKNGSRFIAKVTVTLRRDAGGTPVGFTLICRDRTDAERRHRKLRESQQHDRGLIESNIDVLVTTDRLGVISDVNRRLCEITGHAREDLVGTPLGSHFTEPERAIAAVTQTLAEGFVTDHVLMVRSADDTETILSFNASALSDADGTVRGIVATGRDITEQKRLEAEIARRNTELSDASTFLNNILDSSTEYSIIAADLEGIVLIWNEGARRAYGYAAEEMIGKSALTLHAAEDVDSGRVKGALAVALGTGKFEGQVQGVRKDGERFAANVAITLRRDGSGKPVGYVLISKDITRQKALEDQLRRSNEELEQQNREIQQANRMKSEFLANMSHELRTPLNGIIGFAEVMYKGKVGPVAPKHRQYLADILTSAKHLEHLINDVLDLAKVEAGKIDFQTEPLDVGRLAAEVRDVLRAESTRKRIRVDLEVDPALTGVVGDPSKIRQVCYNYLSNAIKFTPDGGRVRVRCLADGEYYRLEVEDTGIGIRPEDRPRLFVEFQQLDASPSKRYPGTGLGLALTKRLVEAHGGRVEVESTPGKGSTFVAVLPRVLRLDPEGSTAAVAAAPGAASLLVVQDDPLERDWLVRTLAAAGYAVETASSGREAVERCREQRFDAITLDLLLPEANGWDVLGAIRATPLNWKVRVLVVSIVSDRAAFGAVFADDLLSKPVGEAELLSALRRVGAAPGGGPILVVDDDAPTRRLAEAWLEPLGYRVLHAVDVAGAVALIEAGEARREPMGAVIVDLWLSGSNGLHLVERLKGTAWAPTVPLVLWTARELGADERAHLRGQVAALLPGGGAVEAVIRELRRIAPTPAPMVPEPTETPDAR